MDLKEPVTQLIVRFRIHGHGSIRDLDFRHQVEDGLRAALQARDLGMVDGGDIGSGSVNVFAIVDPDQWEAAWAAVRSKPAEMKLLQRAVVARQSDRPHASPELVAPPPGASQRRTRRPCPLPDRGPRRGRKQSAPPVSSGQQR